MEDPTSKVVRIKFKKNQGKSKWIIYESMKDNLMSMITPLRTAKECFNTLRTHYKKKDLSQKREMKNNIQNMKMEKDDTVTSFFTNIS